MILSLSIILVLFVIILWLKPKYNPFIGKNVIVVGNSKELLTKPMGHVIDTFDIVIRLNNFKIDGYEKYTGTKIDGFHMNYLSIDPSVIHNIINNNDIQWMGTRNKARFCFYTGINLFDSRIFQYNHSKFPCRSPTSGTAVVSNIVDMCDRPITVVGIEGYSQPGYYYKEDEKKINKNWKVANTRHCPQAEQALLDGLIKTGRVRRLMGE